MPYRIKSVAELTGIPRNTLVAWERRYNLLTTQRSEAGYRIYDDADVQYLRELKALVDAGVAISEAISRVPAPGAEVTPAVLPRTELVAALLAALVDLDRRAALPLLRKVDLLPFAEAIEEVWRPLLAEVGRLWEVGAISVAQEHFAAGVARGALAAMLRSLDTPREGAVEVVCACVPREAHDLPLLAVAVELALAGWRVTWLGADVPTADLCALLASRPPDVVCLSAVGARPADEVLAVARAVLATGPTTVVALGGPAAVGVVAEPNPRLWVCRSTAELLKRWRERPAPR